MLESHTVCAVVQDGDLNHIISELRKQLAKEKQEYQSKIFARDAEIQEAREERSTALKLVQVVQQELETIQAEKEKEKRLAAATETKLQSTIFELQSKINEISKQLESAQEEGLQLGTLQKESDKRMADKMEWLNVQLEAKMAKVASLEKELHATNLKFQSRDEEFEAMQQQVKKYNMFIQKICQPQFSVVKDPSLTPVNPNGFDVVEGHVLVPLQLLLEGYGFLPEDLRQVYNQTEYCPPTQSTMERKNSMERRSSTERTRNSTIDRKSSYKR